MPKMFLLFSHKLTEQQIADAKESLGVEGFVRLHHSKALVALE